MGDAVRETTEGGVRRLTFCRPEAYNTITPQLRDELGAALDGAQQRPRRPGDPPRRRGPRVLRRLRPRLVDRRPGRGRRRAVERAWDTAADLHVIGPFAATWAKLHDSTKPTLAAVQGWCIAGGTNIVFNAHLILAAESARFGYPPSRVWGVPEAPWTWVARMGIQQARRYMLTGDEITAADGARDGRRARRGARRRAGRPRPWRSPSASPWCPANQLEMITLALNAVANHQYDPPASRLLGTIFDGVARHSQEGDDFVARSMEVGFREAVRERDRPFGDYGERPKR